MAIAAGNSIHLGASGLVFGYATYLISRGIFSRKLTELAIGVIVVATFGVGLLIGLLPNGRISWQAHLFGAVGGIVAARLAAQRGRTKEPAA